MIRVIVRPKVTKFPSGAPLMGYQKHIRSSFARTEEEIRFGIAFTFGDFLISTEIHWMRQCRFAIETKPCNIAYIQSFLLVRKVMHKSSAGLALKNRDKRRFCSLARYLFKLSEKSRRLLLDRITELLFSAVLDIVMSCRNNFIVWNSEVESGRFIRIHLPSNKSILVDGSFTRLDYII